MRFSEWSQEEREESARIVEHLIEVIHSTREATGRDPEYVGLDEDQARLVWVDRGGSTFLGVPLRVNPSARR
jgi:hypothetical protein